MPVQLSDKTFVEIVIRNFNGETLTEIANDLGVPQPRLSEMKSQRQDQWNSIVEALTNRTLKNYFGDAYFIDSEEAEENHLIGIWITSVDATRNQIKTLLGRYYPFRYLTDEEKENRLKKYETMYNIIVPDEPVREPRPATDPAAKVSKALEDGTVIPPNPHMADYMIRKRIQADPELRKQIESGEFYQKETPPETEAQPEPEPETETKELVAPGQTLPPSERNDI